MKIYFLLITVFILNSINAQIVNIPDVNFKAKLLAADTNNSIAFSDCSGILPIKIDANSNGEIEESEATAVSQLFIDNSNISSIEGIRHFTNLTLLNCQNNLLNTIDISTLSELVSLNLDDNPNLVSINVKNNTINFLNPNGLTSKPSAKFFQPPPPCGINGVTILNCPNLTSICIGDSFHANLTTYLNYYSITGIAYTCPTLDTSDFKLTDYFNVYPNPVIQTLYFTKTKLIEIKSISIFDTSGKYITTVAKTNDFSVIDVSNLLAGNYIIKIDTNKGISVSKFVKN